MDHILLSYGLTKETITAIIMLYKTQKQWFVNFDGDPNIFDIVAEGFQGNTLVSYKFIFWLDYILLTSIDLIKRNGFMRKMTRSRRYRALSMTDAD